MKAWWASLISLAVALVVALAAYQMPASQAFDAAAEGAVFGLFPIMWIVVNAIWIYNMTVRSGHFAVLRRSFGTVSDDQRVQAVIIAFCFGALMEALAGFGTPVAICSVMLIALGFQPIKAASVALVANTAPVAFGAIAVPITTLGEVTGIKADTLGAMVGRQTPFLAMIVPLILVFMVDARRGLRQTWPAALVAGVAFAVAQFAISNYVSIQLTDIIASLVSAGAVVAFLRLWQPGGMPAEVGAPPAIAGAEAHDPGFEREVMAREARERRHDPRGEVLRAYAPYAIIIAIFAIANWHVVAAELDKTALKFDWPDLHVLNAEGKPPSSVKFTFNYLPAAGTLLLIAGLASMPFLRTVPLAAARVYAATLAQLKWAILTVAAVLALAYVMNLSAQTVTLGTWLAGAGSAFVFLSAPLGWLGTAVTGSDTSSNSLFGLLQVKAASAAGLSPTLLAAANSSGGVLGKMVSPQNLAIGAAAVGMAGREGELFRRVIGWSVALVLVLCVLVYLQSTAVLSWMVP